MSDTDNSDYGRWLVQARGDRGLTQEGLVTAIGLDADGKPLIHLNTIKNLESGKTRRPAAHTAAILRKFFGGAPEPQEVREEFDRHTRAFLDLVGAYLMRMPPESRLDRIFDLTRYVVSKK